jgi:cytochrome c-type biogenesis protein CcmH
MLDELRVGIADNRSDQQIFDSFVARYGAIVLAAPTTHGFDLVAWIAPFAVFGAALLGTILLVRRWSVGKTQAVAADAATMDPAERERREQIRRETGDGGF